MGQLAHPHHTLQPDHDGPYQQTHLHFVSDLAEKANLESSSIKYFLGEQIRDGSYPLLMAIQNGASCTTIEKLIGRHREDHLLHLTNKFYETALHLALMRADDDCLITMLLQTTQNSLMVETREKRHGNLPIHVAAMYGCSETVARELLRLSPDSIFEKNFDGKTPLDLALENGHCKEEVVRLFELTEHIE